MTPEIEKIMQKTIDGYDTENKYCGFIVHPKTKQEYLIPDTFKGYPVKEAIHMPLDQLIFGGDIINPDKV